MPDDWEFDDWEDEAFDEDVWDATQDGGVAVSGPLQPTTQGGGPVTWSAWDVGTVFALGGWLADHHAEKTAQQVADALADRGTAAPAVEGPRGAAHPPPTSGYRYGTGSGSLTAGDACDPVVLFTELQSARSGARDLMFSLQGPGGPDGPLSLVISAVPRSGGPQLWVVAEEADGGFAASRLVPVFEPAAHGGLAIFASDHPDEVVDAAVWACHREGVGLDALTVIERRPAPDPERAVGAPKLRVIRSVEDAKASASDWLRSWGFDDTAATDATIDDVVALIWPTVLAQVDGGTTPLGTSSVKPIAERAAADGKKAVMFSLPGFTAEALQWASRAGIACFGFNLHGEPEARNSTAASLAAGEAATSTGSEILRTGEPVDPARLAATLYDALVVRGLARANGHLDSAWTDEAVVWEVEVEGDTDAYLKFHPLPLDRRWVREPHPTLPPPWKRHSWLDYARQELGARFAPEKAWEIVEAEKRYDAITYGLTVDAGDIAMALHHLTEELDVALQAFGTRLDATRLRLSKTALEEGRAFAAAFRRSGPNS